MTDLFSDIALGEALVEILTLSLKAQGAITKGDLVKMDAHTAGEIGSVSKVTGTDDKAVGIALKSVSAGEYVSVCCIGIVKVTGSGAITLGTFVKTAAPGGSYVMSAASLTVGTVGKALQTFSDGDTGLILLCPLGG